ncbi:uncharacterized protein LOC109829049 isoform X1 [Asparagus officinalis]|uniref:uncharacterized protein LOC109829049 isoform X1 n=1 Tax=Asparagus officinalis TaxID=4686 RepID=UPI00098E6AD6|nr:uncharacterized protein LOC109829049 isoform X1 [Asparagus officinalis]
MAENLNLDVTDKSNPTTPSPSPRTPTIPIISGFNMGFMPYQSPLFGNTINAFHNVVNYDGSYFPMTHPPISFTHTLSAPTSIQQQCHIPFSSGVHINPHTEGGALLEQRGSKRMGTSTYVKSSSQYPKRKRKKARMDTSTCDESSSPDPKRKRKKAASKERNDPTAKGKSGSHRFWLSKHGDILIPFLAKMTKSGYKADKNFKRTAFNMAAVHMNEHFDDGFTTEHVINHMKSLRIRFHDMQFCRNLSGAG